MNKKSKTKNAATASHLTTDLFSYSENDFKKGKKMKTEVNKQLNDLKSFVGAKEIFLANQSFANVDFFSTGSYYLDKILGTGGWPKGRIIEIYGSESSGKSTLALKAIAECQKNDGNVVYVDSEGSFDGKWAQTNGVNLDKLMLAKPETGEQAVTIVNALVKTKLVDLIIVDSVASMTPSVEIEADVTDQSMGLHARLMSKAMRLIQASLLYNDRTTIIFINQTRSKIGVTYGSNITTTGGNALKFAASVRVELKKYEAIRESADIIGYHIKATVIKNKLAAPMKNALLPFYFQVGFDQISEIIQAALSKGILIKKGTWYYLKDENLGQGIKAVREKLVNNTELFTTLKNQVLEQEK
ncbi:recombination protein RecA [Mycoplasmoides fastidiosum]|uniref:Protein RecA n=1 Tax=Mycoplasmoides fastidiosum TaxID=92758 RepID=A0ABU0LZ41_9BACT|nr:recombinase RecA [Mycoplasmoides fastidiosum]MDQ0513947.1 recombination protein RecA [Mycoplasmoides fastidiosum]UUD37639.1 recombinase RecA [Mycoplasmoides fastidiosum]